MLINEYKTIVNRKIIIDDNNVREYFENRLQEKQNKTLIAVPKSRIQRGLKSSGCHPYKP